MAEPQKSKETVQADEVPILQFLTDHRSKLEVLLSFDLKATRQYKLEGKRKTRTIYLSELLQKIMVEYCDENDLSMADFCELAIIQFLIANGFEEKIDQIFSKKTVNPRNVLGDKS